MRTRKQIEEFQERKCRTVEIYGQVVTSHVYPVDGFSGEVTCHCGEETRQTLTDGNFNTNIKRRRKESTSMYDDMVTKEFHVVKGTNKKLKLTFTMSHPYHTKKEAEKVAIDKRKKLGSDWVLWTKILRSKND